MKAFELFLVACGAAYVVVGVAYLPTLGEIPPTPGMWLLTLSVAATAVLLTKAGKGAYPLGSLASICWLLALTASGIQFLGGVNQPLNLAPLVAWAALQGVLANPLHALFGLLLLLLSTSVQLANRVYGFLPHLTPAPIRDIHSYTTEMVSPVLLALLVNLVLLGARRFIQNAAPFAGAFPKKAAGAGAASSASSPAHEEGTDAAAQAARSSTIIAATDADSPSATQFYSRSYLENLNAKAMKDKQNTLEEVVYFMSRNFKAYTSIGFLFDPIGEDLVVNAVVTKSRNFNYDCVIRAGEGVIGGALNKPAGFVTGNLKSYTAHLDYYHTPENINSIMVMRVMDIQSHQVQGLLVVDSESVRAFTDDHKTLMDRFTRIASAMITNTNMRIQMNRFALQADNQYEISKNLAAALRWEEVLEVMVESLKRTFDYDRIVICGYNPHSGRGYVWKIFGEPGQLVEGADFDVQDPHSLYGSVFRNRRALVVQGFRKEERFVRFNQEDPPETRPQDMLLAPIQDDRQSTLGIVGVENNDTGTYSEAELQTMKTIMANVSNALTKARMYQEMENQATIDGLTQIPNHRKFQDFLTGEIERCQRYRQPLTLLLLDIDKFKSFNDTYGHPVGDLVLKMVARTLTQSIRTSDFCARYGGEEFVVALIQADEALAVPLAERIREAIERTLVQAEGKTLRVTVSIGSASFPLDGTSKSDLIDNADKAMYYSKKNGRNRVTFYSHIRQLPAPAPVHA